MQQAAEAATGTHAKSLRDVDGNPECGPLSVGSDAVGVVRAERLHVSPGAGSGLPGEIIEEMFLGDRQELICRVGEISLRVFDQRECGKGPTSLMIDEGALWVFPA